MKKQKRSERDSNGGGHPQPAGAAQICRRSRFRLIHGRCLANLRSCATPTTRALPPLASTGSERDWYPRWYLFRRQHRATVCPTPPGVAPGPRGGGRSSVQGIDSTGTSSEDLFLTTSHPRPHHGALSRLRRVRRHRIRPLGWQLGLHPYARCSSGICTAADAFRTLQSAAMSSTKMPSFPISPSERRALEQPLSKAATSPPTAVRPGVSPFCVEALLTSNSLAARAPMSGPRGRQQTTESREQTIANGRRQIGALARALNLGDSISESATRFYALAVQNGLGTFHHLSGSSRADAYEQCKVENRCMS